MPAAVSMQYQHPSRRGRFFHHVDQMMSVIPRQSLTQHYEVKLTFLHRLQHGFASQGLFHGMSGLFDGSGLRRQNLCISFAVKNFQLRSHSRHDGLALSAPLRAPSSHGSNVEEL